MTALLTIFFDKEDKIISYVKDAREMGIEVLPPDINISQKGFTIDGDNIRFGLGSIKGLGDAALDAIFSYRPFFSLEDILERVPKKNLNKRNIEALIRSGAVDTITDMFDNRIQVLAHAYKLRGDAVDMTMEIKNYTVKQKLEEEKAVLNIFVSGHPLDRHAQKVNWDNLMDKEDVETSVLILDMKEFQTKRGDWMSVVQVDTLEGPKRMVLFPSTYEKVRGLLVKDLIVKVKVYFSTNYQRNERDIIVKNMTIPKRINKEVLGSIEQINSDDSPTQSLEDMMMDAARGQTMGNHYDAMDINSN